jgi:hypothetical protein
VDAVDVQANPVCANFRRDEMSGFVPRSGRVRLGLLVVTLFAMVLASGASASTTVTIGQTDSTANYLCGSGFGAGVTDEYDFQTGVASGASFVVPAGQWTITSWSTYAGSLGGLMSMMVARPTAIADTYTVVATSPVESLAPSVLDTFSANVRVQPGDLLGFWANIDASCITAPVDNGYLNPSNPGAEPAAGDTFTATAYPGFKLNISATLTPTIDLQLSALLASVTGKGPGTSLADKVKLIQGYAANDKADACGTLGAFLNQVKAQTGKTLTTAQAASFTTQANSARATLGC